jgi:hypothetical protein
MLGHKLSDLGCLGARANAAIQQTKCLKDFQKEDKRSNPLLALVNKTCWRHGVNF